ncbi:protein Aster-C isoform X2 [Erythrolamprus reginae]|uniref:protein Aster-C isoform X2 n=1 Tax=Erythrolamprus reginae TaxID=121349 RepID=UPI00396CDBD1
MSRPLSATAPQEEYLLLKRLLFPEQLWGNEESWKITISTSTYKYRNDEFKKQFAHLPDLERLVVDYACALQKDILLQGRLYLSENWICFYSNIFRWETMISIALKDITFMTKEKTARLIPNAIQIATEGEKFFFTSFSARDRTYLNIFRLWQNALLEKKLTKREFWQLVHQSYGSELGLNIEEMESIYSSSEDNGQLRSNLSDESGDKEPAKVVDIVQESTTLTEVETEFLTGNSHLEVAEPEECYYDKQEKRNSLIPSEEKLSDVPHKVSVQSLDINENFPKEESSASESDEAEEAILECELHGKLFINRIFRIGADKLFEMLFTNSHFMQTYLRTRNITDIVSSSWNQDNRGNELRTLTYTIILNNPLTGKFTTATEKQVLHKRSHKDRSYQVDAEVVTHDVPYHDYFYTVNSYSISHISSQKCRLRISSDVKYKKQPWGFVKNIIEKNTWGGIKENFKQLESELLVEEYAINKPIEDPANLGVLRRRRWILHRNSEEILPKHSIQNSTEDKRTIPLGNIGMKKNATSKTIIIIVAMSIFLVLLVFLNVALFLKLSKIERAAQSLYHVQLQEEGSATLALNLASKEKTHHNTNQAQHVKGVLKDSIALLEQLKTSLTMLQHSFDHLNTTKDGEPES